jgi:hypothetical protein
VLAVAAGTGRADDAGSDVDEDALARLAHRVVESAAGWLATIRVAQNLDALPTQGGCVVLEGANNG